MKTEQQKQAESLYFQTDLTKSEIAEIVGVSRRSVIYWVRDNNWDQIKKSARHMPCFVAENCYHIMARLQDSILSEERSNKPATLQEVNALHKLTITISKLKNRGTLNENLEMMTYFMEHVNGMDPALAQLIKPVVEDYIMSRAKGQSTPFAAQSFPAPQHTQVNEKRSANPADPGDIQEWSERTPSNSEASAAGLPASNKERIHMADSPKSGKHEEISSTQVRSQNASTSFVKSPPLASGRPLNRAARRQLARAAA